MRADRISAKIVRWREHPEEFVPEAIKVKPTTQQHALLVEVGRAVRGEIPSKRFTVRSGHGTGKDAVAAWLIIWFMATRHLPRGAATAPTAHQLADILWSELAKWIRLSIFSEEFEIQKEKLFHKANKKEWWFVARSVSVKSSAVEQGETLAGLHNPSLFIVIDEASGVPDPVFEVLEGTLTQPDNFCLMIGNMTRSSGYFHRSHFDEKVSEGWNNFHWNSEESENVEQSYCLRMEQDYGRESNVYRVRVLGEPPKEDDNQFIPLGWSRQCIGSDIKASSDEPLNFGLDVARYGRDFTVLLPRRGNVVEPWKTRQGMDTVEVAEWAANEFDLFGGNYIAIDNIGIGAGVYDHLKHGGYSSVIHGVNTSVLPHDKKNYSLLRDELWGMVREKCMKCMYHFPAATKQEVALSEELCNELAGPTYEMPRGKIVVEAKRKMQRRGENSPNIADALCLTEYFMRRLIRTGEAFQQMMKRKQMNQGRNLGEHAWMVA